MKKAISFLLIVTLCVSVFLTGCSGGSSTANSAGSSSGKEAAAAPAGQGLKIAAALGDSGASIFTLMGNNVRAYVEQAGGTVVFERTGFSADAQIAFVENQISAGAKGIILAPASDSVANTVNTLCEEAGVYWGITFRTIVDDEIRNIVENSKYYVGNCYEDEADTAYNLVKELNGMGMKKIAFISQATGDTTGGLREAGMYRAAEEFGMEVVAEARALAQATDVTTATQSFLSAHKDLDGVVILATAASGALKAAGKAITDSGRQDSVKLACIDFQEGMVDLFDQGILACASGLPHWGYDPFMTVVKTANAAMGTPISDTQFSTPMKMLIITNKEMAVKFEETFVDETKLYYTNDEMHNLLIKSNNPDLTPEKFQEIVNSFNPLA